MINILKFCVIIIIIIIIVSLGYKNQLFKAV